MTMPRSPETECSCGTHSRNPRPMDALSERGIEHVILPYT